MTDVIKGSGNDKTYAQSRYWAGTLGPLLLLTALLMVGVLRIAGGTSTKLDTYIVIVVPIILIFNIFGAQQPKRIIDTQEALIFEGAGQRHVFHWDSIRTLKVKEFAFTDRIYIRISPSSFFSGRYWIDMNKYPHFNELKNLLLKKEGELHPERIKYQKTEMVKSPKDVS